MTITAKAVDQINKIKLENNMPILRLKVEGGGCYGIMYKMALDDHKGPEDILIAGSLNDFPVIAHQKMIPFLTDVTLDFDDGLNGAGFVFSNPNAKAACGCGASFKV